METNNSLITGVETIPPPSKIEGLQAITKLRPITGCKYCVYTYALNKDIINSDGKVDDFRGMFFIVGCFDSKKEAEDHIKDLIIKTKHSNFYISEYGKPIRIETNIDSSNISKIYVDNNNKIKEMENEKYKQDKEFYEKQIKLGQDINKECEDECDLNHIEHFKRQCYLCIKNKTMYETHKKNMETSLENYKKREILVREHYEKHPEHEKQWLEYLKEKLQERGELALYNTIEKGYEQYRDEILGL